MLSSTEPFFEPKTKEPQWLTRYKPLIINQSFTKQNKTTDLYIIYIFIFERQQIKPNKMIVSKNYDGIFLKELLTLPEHLNKPWFFEGFVLLQILV